MFNKIKNFFRLDYDDDMEQAEKLQGDEETETSQEITGQEGSEAIQENGRDKKEGDIQQGGMEEHPLSEEPVYIHAYDITFREIVEQAVNVNMQLVGYILLWDYQYGIGNKYPGFMNFIEQYFKNVHQYKIVLLFSMAMLLLNFFYQLAMNDDREKFFSNSVVGIWFVHLYLFLSDCWKQNHEIGIIIFMLCYGIYALSIFFTYREDGILNRHDRKSPTLSRKIMCGFRFAMVIFAVLYFRSLFL